MHQVGTSSLLIGTKVHSNVTRAVSTQTTNVNEQLEIQTDGGVANKEKEELQNKTAALEKLLEEKNHHIGKLKAIRQELKEQQSEIQFIKTKEEIEKSSLLRKIRHEKRNHKPKGTQATIDRKRQ